MRPLLILAILTPLLSAPAFALDAPNGTVPDTVIVTRGTKSEVTPVNKIIKGDVTIDQTAPATAAPPASTDQPAPKPIITTR